MNCLDKNGQLPKGFHFANNEIKAINTLYGIILGMTSDGVITDQEIYFLSLWLNDNQEFTRSFPLNAVKHRVSAILEDGKITEEERVDFYQMLSQIVGGTIEDTGAAAGNSTQYGVDEPDSIQFENASFCFTGAFVTGTRNTCEQLVIAKGATTIASVNKSLNYLVIGSLASRDWIGSSHGRKIEKAMHYKETGSPILIIHEETWQKFI